VIKAPALSRRNGYEEADRLCESGTQVEIFMPNRFEAQIVLPNRPSRTRVLKDMDLPIEEERALQSQIRYGTYCWLLRGSRQDRESETGRLIRLERAWNNVCGP